MSKLESKEVKAFLFLKLADKDCLKIKKKLQDSNECEQFLTDWFLETQKCLGGVVNINSEQIKYFKSVFEEVIAELFKNYIFKTLIGRVGELMSNDVGLNEVYRRIKQASSQALSDDEILAVVDIGGRLFRKTQKEFEQRK